MVDRKHPYIALCITIYSGAKVLEYFVELCLYLAVLTRWNNRLHGIEVEHLRTFFESHPKALERIFADITATVASQTDSYRPQTEVHEIETIVAYQTTTMRTDPYEAVGILKDIISKIIRHTCSHIEIAYIIATRQPTLRPTAQGYEKNAYYRKNVSNHLSI